MNLIIELTVDEANVILKSLSKQPFEVVASLITKVQNQAAAQIQKVEEAEKAPEKKQLKKA